MGQLFQSVSRPLRVLLVGYGEMGEKTHAVTISEFPEAQLVAVVRSSGRPVDETTPVFQSLELALRSIRADLAVISTPHRLHFDQARTCLEAGCHVVVDKPITLRFPEAQALVQLAERQQLLLVVGLQRRYEGSASVFRQLIRQDKLGSVRFVHGLFSHRFGSSHSTGWRSDVNEAGAGIIDDSAIHLIDLLIFLAGGRILELNAQVRCANPDSLPHSFTCFFQTDACVTVSASGSYLAPVSSVQEEISIYGTRGTLFARRFCLKWNANPPDIWYKSADGKEIERFKLENVPSGRTLPLAAVLKVLLGKEPRSVLLTEGGATLESHRAIDLIRGTPLVFDSCGWM